MNLSVSYVPSQFGGRRIEVRHNEDRRVTLCTAGESGRDAMLAVEHLVAWGVSHEEAFKAVMRARAAAASDPIESAIYEGRPFSYVVGLSPVFRGGQPTWHPLPPVR